MKWSTEVIKQADVLRNVGDTAAVIFAPSKHPQYDLHSSHKMAVCKQVAGTCVVTLWVDCATVRRHNILTLINEKDLLSVTALYVSIDSPYVYTCDQIFFPTEWEQPCLLDLRGWTESRNKLIIV